jgi:hypothetical protein
MSSDIVSRLRAVDHTSIEDCFLQSPLFSQAADRIEALQADLAKAREALEKAAELAQEKSEELVNRWTSDLGATVETQAAGAAAHIIAGLAGDILGLLSKAERRAHQQKEREA